MGSVNWGRHTTFPLPRKDAERLAQAMRQHRYEVEVREHGDQVVLVYAPPIPVSRREEAPPTVEHLLSRLYRTPRKSGGGAAGQARFPV